MTSRSFNMAAGENFIQSSDLAYVEKIYAVKREGLGYDTNDPNRGYIYTPGSGRITFANQSNGESVFVMWEPGGGPAPPVCVPVSGSIAPPNGVEDVLYMYLSSLSGTTPFTLIINDNPGDFLIAVTGSMLRITKKYPVAGSHNIDITITNCNGGGSLNLTGTIVIEDVAEPNLQVSNIVLSGATVLDVLVNGTPMDLEAGSSIPIYTYGVAKGYQTGIANINVKITDLSFSGTGDLYKNGVLTETLPLSNGNNIFSTSAVTADNIQIILS